MTLIFVYAGVILGLAFCHMVPDSSGLAELSEYGGLNGALILLGFMLNLCSERLSIDLAQKKHMIQDAHATISVREREEPERSVEPPVIHVTGNAPDFHARPEPSAAPESSTNNVPTVHDADRIQKFKDSKALITAHVVEVGVIVHTVILGISVGTWTEGRASLIIFTIAMAFHQFFEGIGLGAIVSVASGITWTKRAAMMIAFTLSFPLSICAGIAISLNTADPTTDELIAGGEGGRGAVCHGVRTQTTLPVRLNPFRSAGLATGCCAAHPDLTRLPNPLPNAGIFESIACGLLVYIGAVSFVAG
jgi:zinc transporter ZupT